MKINGNLEFIGGGQIKASRVENLASDPVSPLAGQIWFNSTDTSLKFYDGTQTLQIAVGDSLSDYLPLAGGTMTGFITLHADPTADSHASTKKYVDDGLALKEDTLTGGATTIAHTDLTTDRALVSDGSGKVAVSTVTTTELAYVSGVTSAIQTQIDGKEPTIGYVPVNKAGDTMGGNLAFDGSYRVIGLAAPVDATDAARKIDLETLAAGLDFQADVLNIQTDATLDPGATPTTGDRYIITNSAALHANFGTITGIGDNDIVQYDGANFVVSYDVSVSGEGALVWDRNSDFFRFYNGTNWSEFGGLSGVTAGVGLEKSGNTIFVNLGAGISQLPTDEVGIDCKTDGGLWLVDPTAGTASSLTDAVLALKLDATGTGQLATSANGTKIAANGVSETEIAASALGNGLTGAGGTVLSVVADTGITVGASGVGLDLTYADANYARIDGTDFTGVVTLAADPLVDLGAATKQYVDAVATDLTTHETRYTNSFVVVDSSTPATSHVITHNLGTQYVNVTVANASDEVIIPDSITFTSVNALTVTFSSSIACKVAVAGLKTV